MPIGVYKRTSGMKTGKNPNSHLKGRIPWNKDIKHTKATKEKISLANKGKPSPMKGKHHTEDTKFKLRLKARKAEKSNFWKGGVSQFNRTKRANFMNSFGYKDWRDKVFKRDNYQCQMVGGCDKSNRYLEANHIKRFVDYPELRLDVNNGITLCKPCHQYITGREKRYENFFKLIIDNQNASFTS